MSWSFWRVNTQLFFGVVKTILLPIISIHIIWYLFRYKFIWFYFHFSILFVVLYILFFLLSFWRPSAIPLQKYWISSNVCHHSVWSVFLDLSLLFICAWLLTQIPVAHTGDLQWENWLVFCGTFFPPVFNQKLVFLRTLPLMPHQLASLRTIGEKVSSFGNPAKLYHINWIFLHLHAWWFLGYQLGNILFSCF